MEELTGRSLYWQNPDGPPDIALDEIAQMQKALASHPLGDRESYRKPLQAALDYCIVNGCGLRVSF